jgi:hypothetical protein
MRGEEVRRFGMACDGLEFSSAMLEICPELEDELCMGPRVEDAW